MTQATRFFLEGLWQQFTKEPVVFAFYARDDFGNLADTPAQIQAFLNGPSNFQATVERQQVGIFKFEFAEIDIVGDYQLCVLVNGYQIYQWLVQLRPRTASAGQTISFFLDGPALAGGKVGSPQHININVRNALREPVDVDINDFKVIVGGNIVNQQAVVTHESTGKYKGSFTVNKQGPCGIDVRYMGNSIMMPPPTVQFW